MSTERIRFTVTQEHIDAGVPRAGEACAVALALGPGWDVTTRGSFAPLQGYRRDRYINSRRVRRFIRAFDDGKPVEPFTGEVYR